LLGELAKLSKEKDFEDAVQSVNSAEEQDTYHLRNEIRTIYPLILTTVDAAINNFGDWLSGNEKIDYLIMDEASQCDIISGLPMLFLAENVVIVGDQKQLSAITDENQEEKAPEIEDSYNYYQKTFLDSVKAVFNPPCTLLKEHYRCDYNIINFCNKFFYKNELIIYTKCNNTSMQITNVSHGKYASLADDSFENDREIATIFDLINNDMKKKYIVTPFKNQKVLLHSKFDADCVTNQISCKKKKCNIKTCDIADCEKKSCGTIHTFQGRGEDEVYFTTVLNNHDYAITHLRSNHNLFSKALINVAVSRAKKKFALVTDREFMINYSPLIKDLIEYIETYGEIIPDKTVCLFDDLYKQMSSYKPREKCDNPWEQTIFDEINDFIKTQTGFSCHAKMTLASLVTDKKYLDNNPSIRDFILHQWSHADFTIYKEALKNPVLVIELDGELHNTLEQITRDEKKNAALAHMEIPLWRISSKQALTKKQFLAELDMRMKK